jgi:hypothetical protein
VYPRIKRGVFDKYGGILALSSNKSTIIFGGKIIFLLDEG